MRKWVAEKNVTTTYIYEVVEIRAVCNACGLSADIAGAGKKSRAAAERFKTAHEHKEKE
jgi:hypothetical protein